MYPDIYVKKYEQGVELILFRHQIYLTMEEIQKLLTLLSSAMEGYGEIKEEKNENN